MSALAALCLAAAGPGVPQEAAADARKTERFSITPDERASGRTYGLFAEWLEASPDRTTPVLVLLHRARSSRGEYRPITPRLKELGYNCLALDLCAGGTMREVRNQTAKTAVDLGYKSTYLEALADIEDALLWAREHRAEGKLVLWGSSYSASLALHVAAARPDLVDGVLAFSPGEYFATLGKGETWIRDTARELACPVFVTSSRAEEADWSAIFAAIASPRKTSFLPEAAGAHGSSALWEESPGHEEYWRAVEAFLGQHFPAAAVPPASPAEPSAAPK